MRWIVLAYLVLSSCGGSRSSTEGHNAADRARKEHAASGEKDMEQPEGGSWGGWRYQGSDDCFYVVGRKCFAEEKAACKAARCKKGKCSIEGGGPATVTCR